MDEIRAKLGKLLGILRAADEDDLAVQVEDALSGSDSDVKLFVTSDCLWGGAGSIADQAGGGHRSESSRRLEAILAELGGIQMRHGIVNARTESWTSTFRAWQRDGV
jgi:hypothetical protein